ncbi:MAG: DoxX family protein [Flavisolibacter sp.]|nr:DoxX family protein [Flavisolibacter sp.]
MKPLVVLLVTFVIAIIAIKAIRKDYKVALSARIAMSVMLLFTSIGHFIYTEGMAMMMPDFVPNKKQMVYTTGIIEILAAIGLQIPRVRVLTAWLLILFFVLVLPANINAAIKHVDYEKGTLEGSGTNYLWFRVPLQILFIVWTYLSSVKFGHGKRNASR